MSPAVSQQCNTGPVDCFLKPGVHITHDATKQLSDITEGNLPNDKQLPLEPQKALHYFFHIWISTPQGLWTL